MFNSEYLKGIKLSEQLQPIIPFFIISNTLNTFRVISNGLKTKDIKSLILPVTLTFFIPPLLANCIYPQFIVSDMILTSFITGVCIYPVLSNFEKLFLLSSKFGQFGKLPFLCALRDNNKPFSNVAMWLIISDFLNGFIVKIFLKNFEFIKSETEILRIVSSIITVYLGRFFQLDDLKMLVAIILFDLFITIREKSNLEKSQLKPGTKSLLHLFNLHLNKKHVNKSKKEPEKQKPKTEGINKKKRASIVLKKSDESKESVEENTLSEKTSESDKITEKTSDKTDETSEVNEETSIPEESIQEPPKKKRGRPKKKKVTLTPPRRKRM